MCHTTDYYHHRHRKDHRLTRLKSITLHLSLTTTTTTTSTSLLPDTLTFVFLPRINGTPLQINSSTYPSDSPAFISLHRQSLRSAVFTSEDRVAFYDGAVFEVHVGQNRLIHGVFRKSNAGILKIESKCVAESDFGVEEVEITAAAESGCVMREKVKVAVKAAKRRRFCRKYEVALVEIPEERECDVEDDGDDVDGCVEWCSSCGEDGDESDSGVEIDDRKMMMEMGMEMEGVKWAFDVGIWAVCIGVGLLVSRASLRSLRRRKQFLL